MDRGRHGEVGLSRASGADGEHKVVLTDGVEVFLLVLGAGLESTPTGVDVEAPVPPLRGFVFKLCAPVAIGRPAARLSGGFTGLFVDEVEDLLAVQGRV